MTQDIHRLVFSLVRHIEPQRNSNGEILEFMPQSKYRNTCGLSLNRYGLGPYCHFRIPATLPHEGVYAVAVDGDVACAGRGQNLSERFNERGYGTIHPRNCFEQGQGTKCKINHLILESAKRGRRIDLWSHRSADPDRFEKQLISELSPPWNAQGKVAIRKRLKIDSERKPQANLVSQDSPAPAGLGGIVPVFSLTLEKTYYEKDASTLRLTLIASFGLRKVRFIWSLANRG